MKKTLAISTLIFAFLNNLEGQSSYYGKVESAYLKYVYRTVRVDPGPNWQGYNLQNKQNGYTIAVTNGLCFADRKVFTGLGLGYLNFEGLHGVSILSDLEYADSKTKLAPLLNLKIGYNHLWNQYDGGRSTPHFEMNVGFKYRLKEKTAVYFKSGFIVTQQALLVPFIIGIRY